MRAFLIGAAFYVCGDGVHPHLKMLGERRGGFELMKPQKYDIIRLKKQKDSFLL